MLTIVVKKPPIIIGEVECEGFPFKPADGRFAFDTETTGLDPWGTMGVDRQLWPARPFAFSFCDTEGNWAFVRWQVDARTRRVIVDERTLDKMRGVLTNKNHKHMHNAIFDWRMANFVGIEFDDNIYDTLIAQHVINPDEWTYKLKPLGDKYLGLTQEDEDELKLSTKRARGPIQRARLKGTIDIRIHDDLEADYWLADPQILKRYAITDAQRAMMLAMVQVERFDEDAEEGGKMWEIFREQMRLQKAIRRMEDRGVRIDPAKRDEVDQFYMDYLEKANGHIADEAGEDFNPNSNVQKQRIFFAHRGLKPLEYKKNKGRKEPNAHPKCRGVGCKICQGTGYQPMCDGTFLEAIGIEKKVDEHGNDLLVEKDKLAYWLLHQSAAKTMHGFLHGYKRMMVVENGDRILHPNYKQAGPITDRLSCHTPNLQNVAADDSGKRKSNVPYRPREVFVPRDGKILYLPDYSQVEVWICALLSKCPSLLEILVAGGDTHGRIAHFIWNDDFDLDAALVSEMELKAVAKGTRPEDVLSKGELGNWKTYKKRRKRSKFVQFCKIFGGGPATMAKTIGDGCTILEATKFNEDYERRFPEVAEYMLSCKAFVKQHGYIENPFGRRYPVDRHFAYKAPNYAIQGSAAHVIKRAMIRVDRMCLTKYPGTLEMLLTIHDELMLEGDAERHSKTVMRDIVKCMQADSAFLGCPIPLPVGMKIATEQWSSCQEIDL